MKIKGNTKKSDNRLLNKENKQYGIFNYDEDNCYPQRILLLGNSSPTAKVCLEIYGSFISGFGFKDLVFYKAIVNDDEQTMDKILELIALDRARFRGFAIHCNITLQGKIAEIYHVPFENVRKASKKKKEETGYDYALYPDWAKQEDSSIKPENIVWLNKLNLKPEVISQEFEYAATQGCDYRGQLFYYSADEGSYPLASCDVIIESMLAEIQSDISTTNNIENGWTGKGMLFHPGKFEEDENGESEERDEFEEGLEDFVGPEGSDIIVVEGDSIEEAPKFIKIDAVPNDKIFQYSDDKVLNKIIRNFKIPKILLSVTEGAAFFNQEQVRDAVAFYNLITAKERLNIEAVFSVIGAAFEVKTNPSNDYTVAPIEFKVNKSEPPISLINLIKEPSIPLATKRFTLVNFYGMDEQQALQMVPDPTDADKRLLVDILGVGGTQALQNVLIDPTLTPEQKKAALTIIFGLTDQQADQLTGSVMVTNP